MGREHVTITTCDGCGTASLSGSEFQRVSLAAPGRLTVVRVWELCEECVAALDFWLQTRLRAQQGTHAPIQIQPIAEPAP